MSNLVNYLFQTKALKISPENKPFWYTSGKISPNYINTHFLYGSEDLANNLLAFIDTEKNNTLDFPKKLLEKCIENYETTAIYKNVIDSMLAHVRKNISLSEISFISGGERRDWFFSLLIAYFLKLPHITINKDLTCVTTDFDGTNSRKTEDLNSSKVLHVADLITVASSYERAWIPAIKTHNGEITCSLSVVDRDEGGKEVLEGYNVKTYSLIVLNEELFNLAKELELISEKQYNMIIDYNKDPDGSMKKFMKEHPEFLENALNSDPKTVERAKLCIEKGFYN